MRLSTGRGTKERTGAFSCPGGHRTAALRLSLANFKVINLLVLNRQILSNLRLFRLRAAQKVQLYLAYRIHPNSC
jgi:hypothetical protein